MGVGSATTSGGPQAPYPPSGKHQTKDSMCLTEDKSKLLLRTEVALNTSIFTFVFIEQQVLFTLQTYSPLEAYVFLPVLSPV